MVQSGVVVQSPFRRGRGGANKRGLRVRKVKVKNLTEKLLPSCSWPTALLPSKCLLFLFRFRLRLLAADCVFDASRVSFATCKCFLAAWGPVLCGLPVWAVVK